jgi:hypothetical protein
LIERESREALLRRRKGEFTTREGKRAGEA